MNAKFTLGCDGFKAIYAFFILNRLFLGQMVDQGKIAVAALCYACYILCLTVWTKRHSSLLSDHRIVQTLLKPCRVKKHIAHLRFIAKIFQLFLTAIT